MSENLTDKVTEEMDWGQIASISIYGALFVIGAAANVFVIFFIFACLRLKNISNVYIFNLAIADLLYIAGLPLVMANYLYRDWLWGTILCKLLFFATGVNRYGSSIFLTILCVDRFLAVCFPISSRAYRTLRNALITVLACWTIVGFLMTPVIMAVKATMNPSTNTSSCGFNDNPNATEYQIMTLDSFTIYSVTLGLSFLFLMWGLYSAIICSLWCGPHVAMSSSRQRSTRRVTFTVLAILVFYTICWVPLWIQTILLEFFTSIFDFEDERQQKFVKYFSQATFILNYINSAFNPILYTLLSESYRAVIFDRFRGNPNLIKRVFKRSSVGHKPDDEELPLRNLRERHTNEMD